MNDKHPLFGFWSPRFLKSISGAFCGSDVVRLGMGLVKDPSRLTAVSARMWGKDRWITWLLLSAKCGQTQYLD